MCSDEWAPSAFDLEPFNIVLQLLGAHLTQPANSGREQDVNVQCNANWHGAPKSISPEMCNYLVLGSHVRLLCLNMGWRITTLSVPGTTSTFLPITHRNQFEIRISESGAFIMRQNHKFYIPGHLGELMKPRWKPKGHFRSIRFENS